MPRKIELNFRNTKFPFVGEVNHGFYVHHRAFRFNGGLTSKPEWTVTHPATGLSLGDTKTREQARQYAAALTHIFNRYCIPMNGTEAQIAAKVKSTPNALATLKETRKKYCIAR